MTCRLCLRDRPLRSSHIIPEFMYKPIYNNVHQIFAIEGAQRVRILQSGVREQLLCDDCEQQFSRYESYAAPAFFRQRFDHLDAPDRLIQLSGLKYRELKLFFLSVLWRLGVTSIPQLRGASLGPHQEKLRHLLVSEDPGDALSYPFTVTEVKLNGVTLDGWILPPRRSRPHGIWVWNITLGRFLIGFFVASHRPPPAVLPVLLSPAGTMVIYRADLREIPSLMRYARILARMDF